MSSRLLVQAELDGERLGDEEIYSFLRLLLPAGAETTVPRHGHVALRAVDDPRPVGRPA